MNGSTAKLLRKVAKNDRQYAELKKAWKKMTRPEKTQAREEFEELVEVREATQEQMEEIENGQQSER